MCHRMNDTRALLPLHVLALQSGYRICGTILVEFMNLIKG